MVLVLIRVVHCYVCCDVLLMLVYLVFVVILVAWLVCACCLVVLLDLVVIVGICPACLWCFLSVVCLLMVYFGLRLFSDTCWLCTLIVLYT